MNAPNGCRRSDLALVPRALGVGLHRLFPRIGDGRLVREPELALVVDAKDLHVDLAADVKDVVQLGVAIVAGLGHVHEALDVVRARDGHERAVLHDALARCP